MNEKEQTEFLQKMKENGIFVPNMEEREIVYADELNVKRISGDPALSDWSDTDGTNVDCKVSILDEIKGHVNVLKLDDPGIKKDLKIGDIFNPNTMKAGFTYETELDKNMNNIVTHIKRTHVSYSDEDIERMKKAWSDPSKYTVIFHPPLSDRAEEWLIVAVINMANKSIHGKSISPQERPLVAEIANHYLSEGNLTRFQDHSLKEILKRLEE